MLFISKWIGTLPLPIQFLLGTLGIGGCENGEGDDGEEDPKRLCHTLTDASVTTHSWYT